MGSEILKERAYTTQNKNCIDIFYCRTYNKIKDRDSVFGEFVPFKWKV